MTFAERVCQALTLSGLGFSMWIGLGYPPAVGPAALFVASLITILGLAAPIYALIRGPRRAMAQLHQSFGRPFPYLGTALLALVFMHLRSVEQLDRNEVTGYLITALALLILLLFGVHRTKGRWWFQRIAEILLICGFAGIAGALMAGQVQFSILALSALAVLHLFNWFVFGAETGGVAGICLAYAIPLAMLLCLLIGHVLAIPLVLSFVAGFALTLPAAKAQSRASQG